MYEESIKFLKQKTKEASKAMTLNHRRIVERFIEYKKITNRNFSNLNDKFQMLLKEDKEFAMIAPI